MPLLTLTLALIGVINLFYFTFKPQSWSLINDYIWLIRWQNHEFVSWKSLIDLIRGELLTGRFHPFYNLYIISLYHFLPVTPLVFRLCQIGLLILGAIGLADIGLSLRFSRPQILLAEVLFLGNLTIKDWITLPGAFEPVAIVCFLFSAAAYLRRRRVLSLLFFIGMLLSKESFFVLLPVFFILEYFYLTGDEGLNRPVRLSTKALVKSLVPLAIFSALTLAFVIFVARLPRVYTAGKFEGLPLNRLLTGFIAPPIKAYGPALLLCALVWWRRRTTRFSKSEKLTLALGLCIIISQTLILEWWGPFDSWFYLHMAIPVGWTLVLVALWNFAEVRLSERTQFIPIGFVCLYMVATTAHGARHLYTHLANARTAAEIACHDFTEDPTLKVYCNCEEGSVELKSYLVAYGICKNPPEIKWTQAPGPEPIPHDHYEVLFSPRCNGPALGGTPKSEVNLEYWKISKY